MNQFGGQVKSKQESFFVDRKEILDKLDKIKERVLKGSGETIFLKGKRGIGKTKIAEKFINRCEKNGFKVFQGRCLYYETSEPYIPFYDALEGHFDQESVDKEKEKPSSLGLMAQRGLSSSKQGRSHLGLIGTGQEEDTSGKKLSKGSKKEMMFNQLTDFILDTSEKNPVLLFLDDLQWIDESSSQLLHHLSRNISENKVIILGGFRPEELKIKQKESPLQNTLVRMKEEKIVDIIEVPKMDQDSVTELVEKEIDQKDIPGEFIWSLYNQSEGNPFYIVEFINSLKDDGLLDGESSFSDFRQEISKTSIPTSIKDIIKRKIDDLDKTEKKILMVSSLVGSDFNFEVLERVMKIDVLDLLDGIDKLIDYDLIEEKEGTDEEIYTFTHLQTRSVLIDSMGKSRKRVYHQKIGSIIENFYSNEIEDHYYELGRHYFEGKKYDKAYKYSIKAAEKAIDSLDLHTAVQYFDKGIESLQKSRKIDQKEEKYIDVLNRKAEVCYQLEDWNILKYCYERIIDKSEEINEKESKAEALFNLGNLFIDLRKFDKGLSHTEQALEIFKEFDNEKGIAKCERNIGYIKQHDNEFKESIEHYKESIKYAEDIDDESILVSSYFELGSTYSLIGDHKNSIKFLKKSVPILEFLEDYTDLSEVYNRMGDQYMKNGNWTKAKECFDESMKYSEKLDNKIFVGWSSFNAAELLTKTSDITEAKSYIQESKEVLKTTDNRSGLAAVYKVEGIIAKTEGDYEKAIEKLKKSIDILKELDIPFKIAEYKQELSLIYKEKGDTVESDKLMRESKLILDNMNKQNLNVEVEGKV